MYVFKCETSGKAAPDGGCAPNIRLRGHQGRVRSELVAVQERALAQRGDDAQICLWDVSGGDGAKVDTQTITRVTSASSRTSRGTRTRSHVRLGG